MTPAEQFRLDKIKKALGDKPEGALVEVAASDLAGISAQVMAVFGLDRATREIAGSFAQGAAGVKPHQVVFVRAEQLRQVLAELEEEPPPPPEPPQPQPTKGKK